MIIRKTNRCLSSTLMHWRPPPPPTPPLEPVFIYSFSNAAQQCIDDFNMPATTIVTMAQNELGCRLALTSKITLLRGPIADQDPQNPAVTSVIRLLEGQSGRWSLLLYFCSYLSREIICKHQLMRGNYSRAGVIQGGVSFSMQCHPLISDKNKTSKIKQL